MPQSDQPRRIDDLSDADRDEFYDIADRFIDLANRAAQDCVAGPRRVSSAMMYATARYNAYIAHLGGYQGGEAEQADVAGYYVEQYEKVLREHLSDALIKRRD